MINPSQAMTPCTASTGIVASSATHSNLRLGWLRPAKPYRLPTLLLLLLLPPPPSAASASGTFRLHWNNYTACQGGNNGQLVAHADPRLL